MHPRINDTSVLMHRYLINKAHVTQVLKSRSSMGYLSMSTSREMFAEYTTVVSTESTRRDGPAANQFSPAVLARQIIDGSLQNFDTCRVHFSVTSSVLKLFCKQRVKPVSMYISKLDVTFVNTFWAITNGYRS